MLVPQSQPLFLVLLRAALYTCLKHCMARCTSQPHVKMIFSLSYLASRLQMAAAPRKHAYLPQQVAILHIKAPMQTGRIRVCFVDHFLFAGRDSSPGTPTFGGGAQGNSIFRDGSLMRDGSLYKDGSITSCLQAAFQAQLEEEEQQGVQVLPLSQHGRNHSLCRLILQMACCIWAQESSTCFHVYISSNSAANRASKRSILQPN